MKGRFDQMLRNGIVLVPFALCCEFINYAANNEKMLIKVGEVVHGKGILMMPDRPIVNN